MAREYPQINSHLLNHLILKEFKSKADFARHMDYPINHVSNWTLGLCSPSVEKVIAIASELGISPDIFYVPGEQYVQMGIESALTKWSLEQQSGEADTLSATEAINFIRSKSPDTLEETFSETRTEDLDV